MEEKPTFTNSNIIKDYAYANNEDLKELVIPEGITHIGEFAFANCKNLKKIILPESLISIGGAAFSGCESLEEIVLPKHIKELNYRTFENCYKLSKFPENITSFGKNCFKNCRSLKRITLNSETKKLPDGMFDGCINLSTINYQSNNLLQIGKRCFRNCKNLKEIPSFIANFNERAFENCTGLTNINIISDIIPFACFRGCKNVQKVLNQEKIHTLASFAFSGCENIEEMDIIYANTIPAEAFSNCKRLKKVKLNTGVQRINARAFFNCYSLSDINLPDTIGTIKKEAFRNCHSIKQITIPANLKSFEDGAFSFMDSLETINVSPSNKTFITPDHKILINQMQQKLVLYASGCKDKSYSLKDYNIETDMVVHELIRPITYIGEYAFAGAKNLEELTLCACVQDIEASAFLGCDNLKKLNILAISLFSCPGFHIREHGRYYFKDHSKASCFIPFETVEFSGDVVQIFPNALKEFTNVKTLILPNEKNYSISSNAFSDCTSLEQVSIPKQCFTISNSAFPTNTEITFENGLKVKGLVELIHGDQYIGDYKLYVLEDGTYYIEQNDKITTLSKKYIDEICSHSEEIRDNPILFIDFMNDLMNHDLGIRLLFNGILMSNMSLENRAILFDNLTKDDKFFLNVLKNSQLLDEKDKNTKNLLKENNFEKVVKYVTLLRKYNITIPVLHSKFFMANYDIESFERLINFDLPLFIKTVMDSNLLTKDEANSQEKDKNEQTLYHLTYQILEKNSLESFIKYVKKYDIKDKYLFQKPFIAIANNPLVADLFKVYDANTKRLLKASMTTQNNISAIQNLNDLLILMKITGALEEDPIIRQKASTFISEKIFQEILPNGTKNKYRIVGDDIHRIFNFPYTRKEFDKEFADFFLENYQNLIEEEKINSGFIQRVYLNFREISRTCTSNKGLQRKLKVTLNKCRNYLSNVKFDGVTEETQDLANLIGIWYDDNSTWINAQKVYLESLDAPRNIFTEVKQDKNGNAIYDNNPVNDLKEKINPNYSFEWLPKQDYDNLVLGKYCNCCAHIEGLGQGIMRASMVLDNCQNLVIRDELGKIIAKSTIYVNKEEGYAVFNTVETSLNHRTDVELQKIYNAFLRGAKAFVKVYNENNDPQITNVAVGIKGNTVLKYLKNSNHPTVKVQHALNFGEYSLNGSGYIGDWQSGQRLVLKK